MIIKPLKIKGEFMRSKFGEKRCMTFREIHLNDSRYLIRNHGKQMEI